MTVKESYMTIIFYCLTTNWDKVCAIMFIVNHLCNANLLSLIYPISLFLYAALENPYPSSKYWNIMLIYTIMLILIKFVYQLPIFCGSPPYTLFRFKGDFCENIQLNQNEIVSRIDYLIGIRKYTGHSSYPKNQGFMLGVIWDYIILLTLFVQKYIMNKLGTW